MSNIIILAAIILYLGMVVWIGVICSKKNSDVGDFYLGGRKLGPVVTAMSAEASDMSSYLLMGVPGLAYLTGLADATWTAIGLALGTYLNWLIVAKKIRLYSHGYQAITLPDYFSKRFGDDKHVITLISAALIVIFFIPYTASGFAACGKLFNSLLGFDYHAAMIVSAVVIVLYCTMGGFLAASTSDLVQSIIMTFALAVVVIFGIVQAGGMGVVLDNAKALPGYLDMFHTHIAETNSSGDYGFFKIVSTLAWGLGYFGMPHILLRFMAIEDENKLKISRRIATVWVFISLIVATGIGVIGLTLSKSGIIDTLTGWIKSRIDNKENSMAGLKGIMKKLVQWILVLLAFVIPVCFKELGAVINIDLSILAFLGWYVLASLIINEYRSILENLVEAGCDVPQVLVKGLEVASKKIENFNENE